MHKESPPNRFPVRRLVKYLPHARPYDRKVSGSTCNQLCKTIGKQGVPHRIGNLWLNELKNSRVDGFRRLVQGILDNVPVQTDFGIPVIRVADPHHDADGNIAGSVQGITNLSFSIASPIVFTANWNSRNWETPVGKV